MLKNNIIHSRMLLHQIKEDNTGIFYQYYSGGAVKFVKCEFVPYTDERPLHHFENYVPLVNLGRCFGTTDKLTDCTYIVVYADNINKYIFPYQNKFLYYVSHITGTNTWELNLVEGVKGCRDVCGNGTLGYGFAIDNSGDLYRLSGANATPFTDLSGWDSVCGVYDTDEEIQSCGYGIRNGYLYRLSDTATRIGSSNSWTFIQGTGSTVFQSNVFGINSGRLYSIQNTTATRIGSDSDWKEVRGTFKYNQCVLGLKTNGELHIIYNTLSNVSIRTQRVGTSNKWTDITESYGICDGELYYIDFDSISGDFDVEQVGTSNKWTSITGSSKAYSHDWSYGICNNVLYAIYEGNAQEVLRNCHNVYGAERVFSISEIV